MSDVDAGTNPVQVTLTASHGTVTLAGITGLTFSTGDGAADAIDDLYRDAGRHQYRPEQPEFPAPGQLQRGRHSDHHHQRPGEYRPAAPRADTDTVAITVLPVNDAPVNTVPGAQTINEDTALVFSGAKRITVSDVDAGTNPVQVTLTASQGTVTLAGTTGLTFSTGDGAADAVMTFTGTLADINTALNNLSFQPLANFNGAAALTIGTNDLGNTGGSAQSGHRHGGHHGPARQ